MLRGRPDRRTFPDRPHDVSGRGWAGLNPDDTLEGHIYFHLGEITVFVAGTPDSTGQPQVADGASRPLSDVLGEAGARTRSAIGVAALQVSAGSPARS
jgi:hypothetical protein